jgi:replicative DNA helicase
MVSILDMQGQEYRPPPHNIEAEQALLGAILTSSREALPIARTILSAEHFYEPVHQRIFAVMCEQSEQGRVVTAVTLRTQMEHDEPIGDMPVIQYLVRLATNATTVINTPDYAEVIRDTWAARQAAAIGSELSEAACAGNDPYQEARRAIEGCDAILADMDRGRPSNALLSDAIGEALEDAARRKESGGKPLISFGLDTLDHMTGGLDHGDFVIVAGRPGMGKTALLLAILVTAARRGHGGVLFSPEMNRRQMALRMCCMIASEWHSGEPINYFRVRTGRYDDSEMARLRAAWEESKNLPVVIDDASGLTMQEMAARTRRYRNMFARRGQEIHSVLIDGIGLINPGTGFKGNLTAQTTVVSQAIKRTARQLELPIIAACQLSRGVESRDDKRPNLADLRESGSLEQDADVVMFPYREAYYIEKEIKKIANRANPTQDDMDRGQELSGKLDGCARRLEIICEKQRQGPGGARVLYADMATNIIRDMEQAR